MTFPTRRLAPGQRCQVWSSDAETGESAMFYETRDILFEAPNWTTRDDALILNGDGALWRMPLADPKPRRIAITGVPTLNSDHVLDPDGEYVFVSANDDWPAGRPHDWPK